MLYSCTHMATVDVKGLKPSFHCVGQGLVKHTPQSPPPTQSVATVAPHCTPSGDQCPQPSSLSKSNNHRPPHTYSCTRL